MRLTKTQKEFRKQIKQLKAKEENNPYDNSRGGNPFKAEVKGISYSLFWLLFILAFAFVLPQVFADTKNTNSNKSVAISSMSVQNSYTDPLLMQIIDSKKSIATSWQQISDFHKQPHSKRNYEQYRNALTEAIINCNRQKENLEAIRPDKSYEALYTLTKEYNYNSYMALKYYLDSSYSRSNSDNAIANNYLALSNENSHQFHSTLIETLQVNGYNYKILDDGTVTWQYQQGIQN